MQTASLLQNAVSEVNIVVEPTALRHLDTRGSFSSQTGTYINHWHEKKTLSYLRGRRNSEGRAASKAANDECNKNIQSQVNLPDGLRSIETD
jgi:hypothetical protein